MTGKEAIGHIKDIICENNTIKPNIVVFEQEKEALYMAIKALEQDTIPFDFELYEAGLMNIPKEMIKILDKIRAEILRKSSYEGFELGGFKDGFNQAIVNVLNIIDKYRAESEGE